MHTNNNISSRPGIVIDIKKSKIRIPRKTIACMGDPEYIQVLVNPSTKHIGLVRCNRNSYSSILVDNETLSEKTPFEIYAKGLIERLTALLPDWKKKGCYFIPRTNTSSTSDAVFRMSDYIPLKASEVDDIWQ